MINLWVICDFTSIHTQVNGNKSMSHLDVPQSLESSYQRVGEENPEMLAGPDPTCRHRRQTHPCGRCNNGPTDPSLFWKPLDFRWSLEITKQRVMHLLRNGWCWHDLACSCQTNKAPHVPEVRHAQLDGFWILARPSSLPHGSMCLVVIDPRDALHISACVNKTKYTNM